MSSLDYIAMIEQSKELDRLRENQDETRLEISKMHKELESGLKVVEKLLGDDSLLRLKNLYIQAKLLSEREVAISSQLFSQLDVLLSTGPAAQQRRRMEGNEEKKEKMEADPDGDHLESLIGEQVAARITQDNGTKEGWFVVRLIHFDRETREVEVLDENTGDVEPTGHRTYKLPMSHIKPFPKPSTAEDYPPGTRVLAVKPGTTAVCKATVMNTRKRKTDCYTLKFDDD